MVLMLPVPKLLQSRKATRYLFSVLFQFLVLTIPRIFLQWVINGSKMWITNGGVANWYGISILTFLCDF